MEALQYTALLAFVASRSIQDAAGTRKYDFPRFEEAEAAGMAVLSLSGNVLPYHRLLLWP
jgi:hypothetical protein